MDKPISSRRQLYSALVDLASTQGGHLLAAQAAEAGVDRFRLGRLERQGVLSRDGRGLYRLSAYPASEDDELWSALLWTGVRGGAPIATLSDETALSLYEVSTVDPARIDLTVSKGTRLRRTQVPANYRVRFRDYAVADVTRVRGLRATTLMRTLLDLILDRRGSQFVDEALERAPSQGLLTSREAITLRGLRNADPAVIDAVRRS